MLTNIPLVWLALAVPFSWRGRSAEARSILRGFLAAMALFCGICALTLGMFSAECVRYEMEFLPTLMLLSVIGIFSLERALANRPALRRVVRWGYGLLLAFSVAFNLFAGVAINADTHAKLGYAFLQNRTGGRSDRPSPKGLGNPPSLPSPHNYLGWILLQKGDVDRAINEFQEAVRLKPDYAEARNNLSIALGVKEASAKP